MTSEITREEIGRVCAVFTTGSRLTEDETRVLVDAAASHPAALKRAEKHGREAGLLHASAIARRQAWAHGGQHFDGPELNAEAIAAAIDAVVRAEGNPGDRDRPIRAFPGELGRTYLAKLSDGTWAYLNHADEWCGCPCPVQPDPAALEAARAAERERCARHFEAEAERLGKLGAWKRARVPVGFVGRLTRMSDTDPGEEWAPDNGPAIQCRAMMKHAASLRALGPAVEQPAAPAAAPPALPPDLRERVWRPIETAPKDRTPILLLTKDPIPREGRPDLDIWGGLQFVARHPGLADDGFDIGWNFAAPVGHGGFPDDWFVGWQPLPTPPAPEGETP